MITQLLCGPLGLASGGQYGSHFLWTIDTDRVRDMALSLAADEVLNQSDSQPKKPILTSACPGWICYAEKTHPYILPHLSRLKSPQALAGTLVKSILARQFKVNPENIWHLALMPCFDKKLEASRGELTSAIWDDEFDDTQPKKGVRDVDCVITAREVLQMAAARGIDFAALPRTPLRKHERVTFPNPGIHNFLFSPRKLKTPPSSPSRDPSDSTSAGTSDGYLWHILQTARSLNPGSEISIVRGRNADVVEYSLLSPTASQPILKAARYYGFRNIQNLVRKLKPAKASRLPGARPVGGARRPGGLSAKAGANGAEYDYVEVMACPGGCTNGGGQIRVGEVETVRRDGVEGVNGEVKRVGPVEQRNWLAFVDEAYFSASESDGSEDDHSGQRLAAGRVDVLQDMGADAMDVDEIDSVVDGISKAYINSIVSEWASKTNIAPDKLIYTTYREVESDVGKKKSDVERVAGLASSIGGGW